MRYLGTDFLYNLDEIYYTKQYICEGNIEFYILVPFDSNRQNAIAISRALLYKRYGVHYKETEYDIFAIDFPIIYHINDGDITIDNELDIVKNLSSFACSVHLLLSSFGSNIFVGNNDNRKKS